MLWVPCSPDILRTSRSSESLLQTLRPLFYPGPSLSTKLGGSTGTFSFGAKPVGLWVGGFNPSSSPGQVSQEF